MALAAVVLWGTTFVSTKKLLEAGLTPADIMFYRFLLAYGVMWICSPRIRWPKNWRDELLFVGAGISGGSLYFLTENSALGLTLASNVALLVATAPILTVILTRLLLKSGRLRNSLIAGSFIALLGVACVVYNGSVILQVHPLGDLLSFTAALTWAFYNIFLKKLDGKYNTLYITRKVFFYGVLTLLPVFLIRPLTTDTAILLRPMVFSNLLFLAPDRIAVLFCSVERCSQTPGHPGHQQLHLPRSVGYNDLFGAVAARTDHTRGADRRHDDSRRRLCGRERRFHPFCKKIICKTYLIWAHSQYAMQLRRTPD